MRNDAAFVLVPYDSARRDWRMGRGPAELARRLQERRHHEVDYHREVVEIDSTNAAGELDASFSLYQDLALKVRAIRESRMLPVVLSGNCAATLGTVAGAGELGVVWFDAHGDFNTPQTSSTGFLDGMSLAALTGGCWSEHTATIPGFVPVAASRIVHIGGRDFDPEEDMELAMAGATVVRGDITPRELYWHRLGAALTDLATRVRQIHIHLDLDVIDASEGRANSYAAGGGLSRNELLRTLTDIGSRFEVVSLGISAYDPSSDVDGRIAEAALDSIETVIQSRNKPS